jgi:hypothetical protein
VVHDSEDGIFPIAHRETHDEVHCYLSEGKGVVGCRDAVRRSACFVSDDFILLTSRTSLHVIGYPHVHPLPSVVLFYPSYCFIPSWVAGCGVVVGPCH